jgi:hypothetical protein
MLLLIDRGLLCAKVHMLDQVALRDMPRMGDLPTAARPAKRRIGMTSLEKHSAPDAQGGRASRTLLTPTASGVTRLGSRDLRPSEARRVARLHQRAPQIVERAARAGVGIEYLGIADLFQEVRLFRGTESDWVLAPVDEHEQTVVPRAPLSDLRRLHQEGLDFLLYVGHEIDPRKTDELLGEGGEPQATISRADVASLVGPVPAPIAAVELAERLDQHSRTVLAAIRRGAPIAGAALVGVLAAPFLLVAGSLASLATVDPIVFGAIAALRAEVGEPAAFFELTRWDW